MVVNYGLGSRHVSAHKYLRYLVLGSLYVLFGLLCLYNPAINANSPLYLLQPFHLHSNQEGILFTASIVVYLIGLVYLGVYSTYLNNYKNGVSYGLVFSNVYNGLISGFYFPKWNGNKPTSISVALFNSLHSRLEGKGPIFYVEPSSDPEYVRSVMVYSYNDTVYVASMITSYHFTNLQNRFTFLLNLPIKDLPNNNINYVDNPLLNDPEGLLLVQLCREQYRIPRAIRAITPFVNPTTNLPVVSTADSGVCVTILKNKEFNTFPDAKAASLGIKKEHNISIRATTIEKRVKDSRPHRGFTFSKHMVMLTSQTGGEE